MEKSLLEKEYYILGGSAYGIRSFCLVPFDNADHSSYEDNFNYFHSSSRIVVECAFGEISMRFAILWKTLDFCLGRSIRVIDACLRLHTFTVNYRLESPLDNDDIPVSRK